MFIKKYRLNAVAHQVCIQPLIVIFTTRQSPQNNKSNHSNNSSENTNVQEDACAPECSVATVIVSYSIIANCLELIEQK